MRIDLIKKVERMRMRANMPLIKIVTDRNRVDRLSPRQANIEHIGTKELGHVAQHNSFARLTLAIVIRQCMRRLDRKSIQMNLPLVLDFGFGWIHWEQPRIVERPVVKGNHCAQTV